MIHIDGFEEFRGEQSAAASMIRADYVATGQWSPVRGRGQAQGCAALSGALATFSRKHPWTGGKFSFGCAHYFNTRGSVLTFTLGTKKYTLWMNNVTGTPMLNASQGGALPTIVRWYYYEFEIDRAAGTATLYINNKYDSVFQLDAIGAVNEVDVAMGYRPPNEYRPGEPTVTDAGVKTYDDFYMVDGPRLGPILVTTRFPSGDKNVEWFLAAQTGNHSFALSQEPPDPLNSFVAADIVGKEERFVSSVALPNANPVIATGIIVLARKASSLSAKLGVFIGGQAGAPLRQDTRTVDEGWRTQFVCFERTDGDTAQGINTADFGFNVSPL